MSAQVGPICKGAVKIRTMTDSYLYSVAAPVVIIDEFDDLLNTYPYDIQADEIKGLWSFAQKQIIGLTASLTDGNVNLARKMLIDSDDEPTLLQFPSSYEFYSNQPQDAGTIIPCKSYDDIQAQMIKSIDSNYYK